MAFVYLAGASFLVLLYPYVLYPIALRFLSKRAYVPANGASVPDARVAMLFCAHNEERSLQAKISNVRAIKAVLPDLDVHVYADGCTDRSVVILEKAKDVLTLHEGHARSGKASGMRILVEATRADVLIFTDANVSVEPDSARRIIAYFRDPQIGTVAGTLHYTNQADSSTAHAGSLYWRLEETIKRLESETGSTMGADGSLFATRKVLYPQIPANLLDDMISSICPLFIGYRVVSAPDVHAYESATVNSADEFRRKRRIACRAYHTHRYLRPQLQKMGFLDRFKYVSHKYIRWFSALFLLLTAIFALGAIAEFGGLLLATAVAATGIGIGWAGHRLKIPVVSNAVEIVLGIVATGLGVLEAIAGRYYQTWVPIRDVRS